MALLNADFGSWIPEFWPKVDLKVRNKSDDATETRNHLCGHDLSPQICNFFKNKFQGFLQSASNMIGFRNCKIDEDQTLGTGKFQLLSAQRTVFSFGLLPKQYLQGAEVLWRQNSSFNWGQTAQQQFGDSEYFSFWRFFHRLNETRIFAQQASHGFVFPLIFFVNLIALFFNSFIDLLSR